jgi:hypothetical protein
LRDSSAFPIIGPEDVADLLPPPIFFLSKILAGLEEGEGKTQENLITLVR